MASEHKDEEELQDAMDLNEVDDVRSDDLSSNQGVVDKRAKRHHKSGKATPDGVIGGSKGMLGGAGVR